MQKKKSKQGLRLSSDEVDLIKYFAALEWTNKAIADYLKRDEDTVSKYRRRIHAESEPEAVRREALKDATRDHWRTLSTTGWGLRGRFTAPRAEYAEDLRASRVSTTPDRREQLLVDALRTYHAPDHRLWHLMDAWQAASQRLRLACEEGWQLVEEARRSPDDPEEIIKPIFDEKVVGAWLRSAIGQEGEQPLLETSTVEKSPDRAALTIGDVYVAAGSSDAVEKVEVLANSLIDAMRASPQHVEAAQAFRELSSLEPQIAEAVEEIGLMEGFPGECPFCPVRTLRHTQQKLDKTVSVRKL